MPTECVLPIDRTVKHDRSAGEPHSYLFGGMKHVD